MRVGEDGTNHFFGLVCTIAVHLALVVLMFLSGRSCQDAEQTAEPQNIIQAKLVVRKGPKKPPGLLPRLESAPAAKPAPAVSLGKAKEENKELDLESKKKLELEKKRKLEEEKRRKEEETRQNMLQALDSIQPSTGTGQRQVKPSPLYGDPDGSPFGNADEARAGSIYAAQVERILREVWSVPTYIPNEALGKLNAWLLVEIAADGRVNNYKVLTPSGNSEFDGSLVTAIQRFVRNFGNQSLGAFPPGENLGNSIKLKIQFTGSSKLH